MGSVCLNSIVRSKKNFFSLTQIPFVSSTYGAVSVSSGVGAGAHCLGMSYYVNFLGGLDINEFHIK